MYEYVLSTEYNRDAFRKCKSILDGIPDIVKKAALEDVDGGVYQHYTLRNKEIVLRLSAYEDLTYVTSEIDLKPYIQ